MKKTFITLSFITVLLTVTMIQISAIDISPRAVIEEESKNTRLYIDKSSGDHYYGYYTFTSVVTYNTKTNKHRFKNQGHSVHPYNGAKLSATFDNAFYNDQGGYEIKWNYVAKDKSNKTVKSTSYSHIY